MGGTDEPVKIYYKAKVFQNTGIDWKDVKLSCSSANPSVSGIIPVLNPWYIDFAPEIMIRGASSRSAVPAARMKAEMDVNEVLAFEDIGYTEPPPVSISTAGTNFVFDIDLPQNIPSTGEESLIELQRLETAAFYKYKSVPKLRQDVYLAAGLTEWESLNLLDGQANIYFGNSFTGETYISRSQLSDTMTVSLGRDESISIKREKRTDYSSTRMIGANRQETQSFLINIRNNRSNAINLVVNDQLPVSRNSQVSVEAEELSGARYDELSGKLEWTMKLDPGESRELILTYRVKYPKNQKVILE